MKFKVGDRVRCVEGYIAGGIAAGSEYTIADQRTGKDGKQYVNIVGAPEGWCNGWYASRFEPVEPIQDEGCSGVTPGTGWYYDVGPAITFDADKFEWTIQNDPTSWTPAYPRDVIPQPAKPERVLTAKQEAEGQGIARAVERMNSFDPRLGCVEFNP